MPLPRTAFRDVADNSDYESHLTYTAQSDLAAGTVLTESDFGALKLSNSADQILVYTGAKASPIFLSALDNSKGYSHFSELPPVCTSYSPATCTDRLPALLLTVCHPPVLAAGADAWSQCR